MTVASAPMVHTKARYRTYEEFIAVRNTSLLRFEHIPSMVSALEKVCSGEITRLMIWAPPGYLKSETCTRLFIPYFLHRHEKAKMGLLCHSDRLALELSEDARDNYAASGGAIRTGTDAKSRWANPWGGGLWAVGLASRFLGKRYLLGVVDDPQDPEQTISPTFQRRFERFWTERFINRQEPEARIVVVMQRLGITDPIDYLLRREVGERTEEAPEHWHILVLDEKKSNEKLGRWDGPMGLPKTCTLLPEIRGTYEVKEYEPPKFKEEGPRKVGEYLALSRFNQEQADKLRSTSGTYLTTTQRQQRPMKPTGEFWKEGSFRLYDELPAHAFDGGKDWDTAYGEDKKNAASAYVQSYRGPGGLDVCPIYIEDIGWEWKEFPELVAWMSMLKGPHFVEKKASGKSAVQSLKTYGIAAEEVGVAGDKLARASAAQPAVETGRVYVNKKVWDLLLFGEGQGLLRVTVEGLENDTGGLDLNDAFVQAIHRHLKLSVEAKKKKRAGFA